MKPVFLLLGIAFILVLFFEGLIYLVEHAECTKDHALIRCRVVYNEL